MEGRAQSSEQVRWTGRSFWGPLIAILVVGVLAVFYVSGRLDYALYPLGLNFHDCARNGLGATFCGADLTRYEQQIKSLP